MVEEGFGFTEQSNKVCVQQGYYIFTLFIVQHITIPVEDVQDHERSSNPPVHYTGGTKVNINNDVEGWWPFVHHDWE